VRLPADGFYFTAFRGAGRPWFSSRLEALPNGLKGWAPIAFTAKGNDSLMVENWVVDDDKEALLDALALAGTPDRLGMVITRQEERSKQMKRVGARIAKERGKGDKDAAEQKLPDEVKSIDGKHGAYLRVTVDGAHEDIEYPDGASDEQVLEHVKRATEKVSKEIDPTQSVRVAGGATKTGIVPEVGKSEVALPEGFQPNAGGLAANTPGYKARIISHGPGGDTGRESTVLGAELSFTMELDYAAESFGLADETLNRAQNVAYQWELIDVSNVDPKALAAKIDEARAKGPPTARNEAKEIKALTQKGKETDSGIVGGLKRDLSNTWEDTKADLEMISEDPTKAPYLAVVAISDIVQIGGALIGAFFSAISQPLNERKIDFNDQGVFFLRCFAWPIVEEDYAEEAREEGRRLIIRAPSPAMVLVDVVPINQRAKQTLDAREAAIANLRAQLANPPVGTSREHIQAQLDAALAGVGDADAVGRQATAVDTEIDRIRRWNEYTLKGVPLEERADDLREWKATLDLHRIELAPYLEQMLAAKKHLGATHKRYTQFGQDETTKRPVQPLMNFVSEETGEVYPLVANLVELKDPKSKEGRRVWRLIDTTSGQTQDTYEGVGTTHTQAIRAAFVKFRENAEYGRGSLAIRLPTEQLKALTGGEEVTVDPLMRARPGDRARAFKRLQDLATAAEIAAIAVTGPAALALGVTGAVAGGIVAAENLRRRAGADRLKFDMQTGFDILGVVGAVVAVGGPLARGRATRTAATARKARELGIPEDALEATAKRAAWVDNALHIAMKGQYHSQWLVIPASTYHELAQIEAQEQAERAQGRTPSPGKYRARRLEALARGMKSGLIQIYTPVRTPHPDAPARTGGDAPAPTPKPTDPVGPVPPRKPPSSGDAGPQAPRPTEQTFWAPERPQASGLNDALVQALGGPQHRVRLVNDALIAQFWAHAKAKGRDKTPMPEGTIALFDPDTGHVYLSKKAFLESPRLQRATLDNVVASMDARGRAAFSEPLARAFAERQLRDLVEGAPDSDAVSPQARGLLNQLEQLAGLQALRRALFHNDGGPLAAELADMRGAARARALLAALRRGNLDLATRLAAEPNPALAGSFGPALYQAIGDMFTLQSGGQPANPARARLAQHLADVVGQQVVERAYFDGDVDSLEATLKADVDESGVRDLRAAMSAPTPDLARAAGVLAKASVRRLGPNVDAILAKVEAELAKVEAELAKAPRDLPPDWSRVREHIINSTEPTNQQIAQHLAIYLAGLRSTKLIMRVLREALTRAWAADRSINWALREMALESGARRDIPLETIPHRGGDPLDNDAFWSWAFRKSYFVDLVFVGGDHMANSHLLQDLVADLAFEAAGRNMSGPEFRALLGQAEGTLVPSPATKDVIPDSVQGTPVPVGQLIWFLLNDTFGNYLPRPELLYKFVRHTGMH
jgi:hypothetical protein